MSEQVIQPVAMVWLPTDPPRPCPDVLTAKEACVFLRIDGKRPLGTLEYYRQQGWIRGVQIGRNVRYPLIELQKFVRERTEGANQ